MRRCALVLILLLAAVLPARAQQPGAREQVRRAAMDYIEGFYEGDSTKLVRSVSPNVRKNGYARGRNDSTYRASAMPYDGFMRYAAGVRAGRGGPPPNAPRDIVIYDVQDQTASVKVTAWWGTDYMLLGKENGRWMITHVLWQSPPRTAVR